MRDTTSTSSVPGALISTPSSNLIHRSVTLGEEVENILTKVTDLCIVNLNIDGVPIAYTHPSTHIPLSSYSLPSP
jgi:hypothetical protein